ncbi:MAG TPA: ureidoglycolate lyase [Woeseiaceae bacterium]|nr:ureidoglycolate lyase [Woeseiaceae bacterium]
MRDPVHSLRPLPLTAERFAPYGDVIAASPGDRQPMNEARFERFDDLARVSVDPDGGGRVAISIARCRTPTALPYRFDMVERHPLGSQAFVPLNGQRFVVVVAPPGEAVEIESLRAFVTNGRQGVNYHRGTWHMPLIALEAGQEFLVIDRAGEGANCDQLILGEQITLLAP